MSNETLRSIYTAVSCLTKTRLPPLPAAVAQIIDKIIWPVAYLVDIGRCPFIQGHGRAMAYNRHMGAVKSGAPSLQRSEQAHYEGIWDERTGLIVSHLVRGIIT